MSITALRRRLGASDEAGFAMILVMGFLSISLVLAVVVMSIALRTTTASRHHVSFEQALSAAENGIDQLLGRLNNDQSYGTGPSVPSGGFPACSTGYKGTREQCWAKKTLVDLANSTPSLVQHTGVGDYIAMRPANRQTVYSLGWSPYKGAKSAKTRLLKAEYLFAPYAPTKAILTGGSVDLSGSVLVDARDGSPAPVHSNANITSLPSDQIYGPITASGSYDGRATIPAGFDPNGATGGAKPLEGIPRIDPRYTYRAVSAQYATDWYDLCPDGKVRQPDTATFLPCTGTVLSAGGTYRGWVFTPGSATVAPIWSMELKDSPYQGVYYVYQGDAHIGEHGGNSHQAWYASVIAEAKPDAVTNAATCNKLGGNIDWKLFDISAFISGLVLEAGADLFDSANNDAGNGLFAAADQVHLHTSSATLTGAVIAGEQCGGGDSNEIQGVQVHFDRTGEAPVSAVVNTTQWLEYVG